MKDYFRRFLGNFPILDTNEVELLVNESNIKKFEKGTLLLKEGQIAKNCYLVLQGCLREYQLKNGIEKSTAFYLEGDSVAMFTSQKKQQISTRFLECVENAILVLSDEDIEKEMCRLIPRLNSIIQQKIEEAAGNIQDRLAAYIVSTPEEKYKQLLESKPEIFNRVPQYQIASYIGVTPESLSRIRKRLMTT